ATVGLVLQLLRERGGIAGVILAALGGMAWNIITFLVIPVLVVEGVGPVSAIKRSAGLLKKTWGEQIIGTAGIGLVFGLLGFAVAVVGIALGGVYAISAAGLVVTYATTGIFNFAQAAIGCFLAFCYFARHHVMDDPQFDSLRLDGVPVYPQHEVPLMSPLMGVSYSGEFEGKCIWVHHTHDASLWPPQGIIYHQAVLAAQGEVGANERFRIRWTDNAEHIPPMMIPSKGPRAVNTWLVDYGPVIEQTMADLVDWVERGIEPAGTAYSYADGKVTLPTTAAERGGIQAVVKVSANGGSLASVKVGEPVSITAGAELPPNAGTIISLEWDFDGKGTYPLKDDSIDGSATSISRTVTQTYDAPGTYFVTALVHSHRAGDIAATSRRVPNLAQARVVVT
ncbi:MAG: DUF6159 family protein, partial [Actinomycetota bacterium]